MRPEHALDVERSCREALGDRVDLRRRDEQEHRARIDEATDEPGAGDAVDLRPRARDPDCASLLVERRHLGGRHCRQVGLAPALEAVFEPVRRNAGVAQPGGDALAELRSALADHNGGAAGEFRCPSRRIGMAAAHGAGNEPGIGAEVLVGANVDQGRAMRRADEARQLVDGYRVK